MGQKVNPHGIRVGVIKDWDSRWFAKDNVFGDTLVVNNISLGENMACGQTSAKEAMLSWKHSPGHYRNIKNKGYH